jgi:hypothetical protein
MSKKITMRNFDPNKAKWIVLCVNNMYMNGIHNGIQAAHAAIKLVYVNAIHDPRLGAWCCNGSETLWVKRGGMQKAMREFRDLFMKACQKHKIPLLPSACFYEEADALNGTLTSIAFLIPDPDDLANFPSAYKRFWTELETIMPRGWAS